MKKKLRQIGRVLLPRFILKRIYRRMAFRYINSVASPENSNRKSIIILNHFFDQDVRALTYARTNLNLIEIKAEKLFRGARIFFSSKVKKFRSPYADENPERLAEYNLECRLIFNRIREKFDPALFVITSDIFYWVREFISVAHHAGVKTVVLDKEGIISENGYDDIARKKRTLAPFMADHIYVYSDRQRKFWRKSGAPEDKITVIGQPRSDLFYRENSRTVDDYFDTPGPLVTFFSYEDAAYIPLEDAAAGLSWKTMKSETHDTFFRLAAKHQEYNFIIKTHPQQSDLANLQRKYSGLKNLRVVGGSAVANELIQRSELIIGFQTTALIEALFLNRRIIYTAWDENYSRYRDDILPLHLARGIKVARSIDQFHEMCRRFFSGDRNYFRLTPEEVEERDEFINRYFYKPDGRVCERFFESVEKIIP